MRLFQEQNEKIKSGTLEDGHYMHLDTLGIVNGFLDAVVQGQSCIDRGLVPVAEICDTATQCSQEAIVQHNQLGHSCPGSTLPTRPPIPSRTP